MLRSRVRSAHGVFFGRVLVSLQNSDSVAAAQALDLPHGQVSEFLRREREERRSVMNGIFPKTRGGKKKSSPTSYESLMRSVMLVCLAGAPSGSLLLGSGVAGGEGETGDDSSLPIWSRKLQEAKKRYPHLRLSRTTSFLTAASLTWSGSGVPGRHHRWCTAAPCWPPAPPGPAGRWP